MSHDNVHYDETNFESLREHNFGNADSEVKRKSNQRIRVHLLRSALYISVLVTVCSIPFAVGQRPKQTGPQSGQSSPSKFPTGCGSDWQIRSSPNLSANTNILFGVGGVYDAPNVWAVGVYYDENFTAHTLTEYWDGMAWIVESSPNPRQYR